jgi:hypothetical protein
MVIGWPAFTVTCEGVNLWSLSVISMGASAWAAVAAASAESATNIVRGLIISNPQKLPKLTRNSFSTTSEAAGRSF